MLAVPLNVVLEFLQPVAGFLQFSVSLLVFFQLLLVVGQNVYHAELEVLLGKQQVLVLRMDVHQLFAQIFQCGQRHGGVVDERTALTGSCQLAAYDCVVGIIVNAVLVEQVLQPVARQVEVSFYDTLVTA